MNKSRMITFLNAGHPGSASLLVKAMLQFPLYDVSCVLAPTLVDFSVRPYGDEFKTVEDAVGHKRAITPLKEIPPRMNDLPKDLQQGLHVNMDASDEEIIADSAAYLHNSLCKANLARYHASRALALTYDFNNKECDTYEADIKTEPTGVLRRQRMRDLLHGHLQRKARELGIEDWEQSVLDFPDLVQTDKASDAAFSLIVCNPGIEACTYIHEVEVQTVFAYGMFVGDPPISPGPCGTRVRSAYTRTFVDLIRDKKTPMFLLPMELFSDATWELDGEDVHDICGKNAPLEAHISQYKRDYRGLDECILPGLLAAALIVNPGLCFQKQVRFEVQKNAEGAEVIVFEGDEEGNITLYFPDA